MVAQMVKKQSTCNVGDLGWIPGQQHPLEGRAWQPTPYSCLDNPHGQRSLVGYSPWGRKELDTTEQLNRIRKKAGITRK